MASKKIIFGVFNSRVSTVSLFNTCLITQPQGASFWSRKRKPNVKAEGDSDSDVSSYTLA